MGTHSTVKFYDEYRNLLNIYNQYDGYVSGEGKEILEFIKDEKWKGNGLSDTALLYVCYKKEGKPLHTYATTENDIQEYNYIIRETNEGLRFTITHQTWNDKDQYILVTLLNYADLDEFEKYVNTQCLFDNIMYKHCEEISSELRNYLSNMDYEGLLEQIKLNGWTDVVIN